MLLAVCGVLVIMPDALLIRIAGLEDWDLLFWRGILAGTVFGLVALLGCFRSQSFEGLKLGWDGMLIAFFEATIGCTFILSFMHTTAANVLVIMALVPLFAALINRFFRNLHLSRRTWLAILLCFCCCKPPPAPFWSGGCWERIRGDLR